jgi:EAL domain-containing protein (putative c-di-GMP-specific phosphodiesterase class I)/CHASE2 domain-containing sensor protein
VSSAEGNRVVNPNSVINFLTFSRACTGGYSQRKHVQVSKRSRLDLDRKQWKLLLWTAVAGLIFGLIGFGDIAEGWLRTARNSLHWHKASGDIVLVKIDDESLRQIGRWPWSRKQHARLADELSEAGAKRIFFDLTFSGAGSARDDRDFRDALKRSGRVILAARTHADPADAIEGTGMPLPMFAGAAKSVGSISWRYNFQLAVTGIPYGASVDHKVIPSFSSIMADRHGTPMGTFAPDYSTDPRSIPTISAARIIKGDFDRRFIAGKDVVVGATSEEIGDQFFVPGTGKMGGAYVHIIGGETLKSGQPVNLGWAPLFLFALAVSAIALSLRSTRHQAVLLAAAAAVMLFGPAVPESYLMSVDVTPGLFVVITVTSVLGWRSYKALGLVNPISNLPNLNALRSNREGREQALIAARILNYEEVVSTLPPQSEIQLIEQIVARLKVGSPNRILYQGDAGIFAWLADAREPFGNHLEALHALFRNPARVADLALDLSIAFGVEVGSGRSIANRLASALVAADEAAHHGLKWKYHDPESLQNASWKLSMLSQLDEAIDRGEVWVAYQPKLELTTKRIVGAEALARWTHPEKGPIAASEFVAAAEQNNRIGKLTDFVLQQAVAAAAQINKRGTEFEIAVNLSARLLTDKGFTLRLAALLARHHLPPERLTLELTETAALTGGEGLDMITMLRDLGVNIAIDDYGTGLSTLDYLKKIPANEIKIDQSFVKGVVDNRSDRLMVQSTIGLAHSLGRKVVAEGVEHRDILDLLVEMKCDIAQGFAIGRPMSLDSLIKRLSTDRKRGAA